MSNRPELLQRAHKQASKWFMTMPLDLERDKHVAVVLSPHGPVVFIDTTSVGKRPQLRLRTLIAHDGDWEDAPGALLYLLCESSMLGPSKLLIAGGQLKLERLLNVELTSSKRLAKAIKSMGATATRVADDLRLLGVTWVAPE
jgi:hypothetical protein